MVSDVSGAFAQREKEHEAELAERTERNGREWADLVETLEVPDRKCSVAIIGCRQNGRKWADLVETLEVPDRKCSVAIIGSDPSTRR